MPTCRLFLLLCCIVPSLAIAGCKQASNPPSGASSPSAAGLSATADLQGTIQAMVTAINAERDILRKALASTDSLTAEDRTAYWAALQDQRRRADQLKAILAANPTWLESVCGWYDTQINQPWAEVVRLRNQLSDRDGGPDARNAWTRLLKESAPSEDAVREYMSAMADNPGEPTNLHVMCIKFGHIKDE